MPVIVIAVSLKNVILIKTIAVKRLFLLLVLCTTALYAQQDAWIYFSDKPDAAYYLSHPLEMLSQKALDRRAAHSVTLDDKDVPVPPDYLNSVAASSGITVMAKSRWLNAVHVRGEFADINALRDFSFVSSIEFADKTLNNRRGRGVSTTAQRTVNKNLSVQADFNYGAAATQIEMLNGHRLHQSGFTGAGVTIAVLDAGFPGSDTSVLTERARQNGQLLGGYNFVEGSDNVYTGGNHGTMVLSTMAGYTDGSFVGTAPDANYYLFVTESMTYENPVEESFWVAAAEQADSLGVDVINTSLGYFRFDNPSYDHTYEEINGQTAFITRGANVAFTRGMFLVTSAGNSAASSDPHISVPADAFNTLTLGAVDSSEEIAYFSSLGPSYDGRIKPDVVAMGLGVSVGSTDGSITSASGTSFSGPITAGLVACLWQALPQLSNADVLQKVKQSADRYNNPDNTFGYGVPDFWAAYQDISAVKDIASNNKNLLLYPNPVSSVLTVVLPKESGPAEIVLFNNLGQVVLRETVSQSNPTVNLSGFSSGVYSYRLLSGNAAYTGKVIKH